MATTLIGQASGTIGVVGDSDWFKVSLTAGTEYVFDVGGGTLSSAAVSLYDGAGNLVISGTAARPMGGAETTFMATTTGTYYVGASGIGGTTDHGNLQCHRVDGRLRLCRQHDDEGGCRRRRDRHRKSDVGRTKRLV